MTQAPDGHAATTIPLPQQAQMDVRGGGQKPAKTARPADFATVASKGAGSQRHRNKQNLDYVWRSGLAGGLAGCAVSIAFRPFISSFLDQVINMRLNAG